MLLHEVCAAKHLNVSVSKNVRHIAIEQKAGAAKIYVCIYAYEE